MSDSETKPEVIIEKQVVATEPQTILELKEVSIARGNAPAPVLERFSFTLSEGETAILLGETDCGAEALLRAVGRVPDSDETVSGTILYRGADVRSADRATRIAFLPSTTSKPLSPASSAEQQLARVIARKLGIPRAGAREELRAAYARLPDAPPYERLKRTAGRLDQETLAWGLLAAVVAQAPELILADNPVAGIGPRSGLKLTRALLAQRERLRSALLYAAREVRTPSWLGGRIVVMRRGRVIEEGPAERLTTEQTHAYTHTLFRSLPKLSKEKPARNIARGETLLRVYGVSLSKEETNKANGRDGISFELRRGGSLALVGEEGSGRRALASAVLGLDRIEAGRVVMDSVDLSVLSEKMSARLRRRIAFVAGSDDALDPRMTIHDTVDEPLRAHLRLSGELVALHREAALKRVGLASHGADRTVASLPAFDRRRLQVARAIVSAPLLAIIDEPLQGLDAFGQAIIRDLLGDFRAQEGPAFLVITSDISVAQALADDAMVFKAGRVVARGPIYQLIAEAQDETLRALIDAASPIAGASLPKEPSEV